MVTEFSVSLVFCQGKVLYCFDQNRYTDAVIVVYPPVFKLLHPKVYGKLLQYTCVLDTKSHPHHKPSRLFPSASHPFTRHSIMLPLKPGARSKEEKETTLTVKLDRIHKTPIAGCNNYKIVSIL